MLVSEAIDRAYSTWIFPGGASRPTFDKLASNLGGLSTDLTVALSGRLSNVPRDSVLEIGSEQILVYSVSGSTVTAQERGYRETDVAAHTAGAIVYLDHPYPRKAMLNAVISVVASLYPMGLYVKATDVAQTFSTAAVKVLPTGGKRILGILVRETGTNERYRPPLRAGVDFLEYREFSPPKYQLRHGGAETAAMTVSYAKDFTAPVAESDDLTTLGVPLGLQAHLPMAVAGYLLQGKDLPRVQIDEIRRALAAQGVQVGAALNVGQLLLRTFEDRYVVREIRRQSEEDPVSFEFVGR